MSNLNETLTFRAPLGTTTALADLARREGKRPSEVAREAIVARLSRPQEKDAA